MLRLRLRFSNIIDLGLLRHVTTHFKSVEIYYWIIRTAHLDHALLLVDGPRERRVIICIMLCNTCDLVAILVEANLINIKLLGITELLRHVQQVPIAGRLLYPYYLLYLLFIYVFWLLLTACVVLVWLLLL